jgi:predicted metal-dependent peptidase
MAVAVATAANAGKLPGYLERLVKELKKPKVNWKDYTRKFIDQSMTKDFSYARPNKRSWSSGVLMPGYIPDRIHHLICVVDVSGSISNQMMIEMVSEAAGALDEGVCDHLTVIYADDGVRVVDEFDQGDLVQARTMGGGGTDFTESFEWIRTNAPDAACVIYLTDMCTSGWGEEPSCPVLWAAFLHEAQFAQLSKVAPFGESILIPRTSVY